MSAITKAEQRRERIRALAYGAPDRPVPPTEPVPTPPTAEERLVRNRRAALVLNLEIGESVLIRKEGETVAEVVPLHKGGRKVTVVVRARSDVNITRVTPPEDGAAA